MYSGKRIIKNFSAQHKKFMPFYTWDHLGVAENIFCIPINISSILSKSKINIQATRNINNKIEKCWADAKKIYKNGCSLPKVFYMQDIIFGYIPREKYSHKNIAPSHDIIWVDKATEMPLSKIKALAFRGKSINYFNWEKTYKPYHTFSKFMLNTLRLNRRLQISMHRTVESMKNSGAWDKLTRFKDNIHDIAGTHYLTDFNYGLCNYDKRPMTFMIPKPIISIQFDMADKIYLKALLSHKINYEKQYLNKDSEKTYGKDYVNDVKTKEETVEDKMNFNRYVANNRRNNHGSF